MKNMNANDIIVEAEKVDTGERVTGFVCGCKLCRTTEGLTNFCKARPIGRLTFANGKAGGIAVYTDTLSFGKTSDGTWNCVNENENVYMCSACGYEYILNDGTPQDNEMNYCCRCGADMRGDELESKG